MLNKILLCFIIKKLDIRLNYNKIIAIFILKIKKWHSISILKKISQKQCIPGKQRKKMLVSEQRIVQVSTPIYTRSNLYGTFCIHNGEKKIYTKNIPINIFEPRNSNLF